jgi:histidinol-phosphate aminotransferase
VVQFVNRGAAGQPRPSLETVEFAEKLSRLKVYPAADGYALGPEVALMASNETPYPPLPAVRDAVAEALSGVNRYPDPSNTRLRKALSDRYDVPANRIAIGNGSCDILLAAGDALLEPGAEVVYAWPSFSVYPHLAAASGARAIEVPLDATHTHDLDAMLAEITVATRLVIVCNPNNPTSTALPLDKIAAFVEQVPRNAAVILDEAYCEFNLLDDPDASVELLDRFPNLVLLRTFSKAYGLCGLRVGYGLCGSTDFRNAVDAVRQPFYCNVAAQAAAIAALRSQDEIAARVETNLAERLGLADGLTRMGIEPAESQANFVWFDLPGGDAAEPDVVKGLAERRILVRAGAPLGRPGALRVTVGTAEDNVRFLAALGELV